MSQTDTPDRPQDLPTIPCATDDAEDAAENRRRHQRAPHRQPVRLEVRDENDQVVNFGWAEVLDLSPTGVQLDHVRLYKDAAIGEEHRVVLSIVFEDGTMALEVQSSPRWRHDSLAGERCGLEFDTIRVRVA